MYQFDKDIELTLQAPETFQATVSGNWSVDKNPDGGYLMAMLAHAVQKSAGKQWPLIVTANFIARCTPGPGVI